MAPSATHLRNSSSVRLSLSTPSALPQLSHVKNYDDLWRQYATFEPPKLADDRLSIVSQLSSSQASTATSLSIKKGLGKRWSSSTDLEHYHQRYPTQPNTTPILPNHHSRGMLRPAGAGVFVGRCRARWRAYYVG
ncbi:hypothetical protein IAT38_007518 [Cryptococcus sp. DSM 104549]